MLRAWEAWGPEAVDRFDGMFGLAVLDSRSGTPVLRLYRDPAGEKPVYWWSAAGSFAFASEAKALLRLPGLTRDVDPEALATYLAVGFVPSPMTMFRGVQKLEPGQAISVTVGKITTDRYWRPPSIIASIKPSPVLRDQVRDEVTTAVAGRLRSDVPLGVFLSGGVDSTIVTAVAARSLDAPVRTFTSAFEVGPRSTKYNIDADTAERVARHFRTDHTRLTIRPEHDLMGTLNDVVQHLDEPLANPTCITTFLLAREVKRSGVSVMLTGDGSDESSVATRDTELSVASTDSAASPARDERRLLLSRRWAVIMGHRLATALRKADEPSRSAGSPMAWWTLFGPDRRERMLVPSVSSQPMTTLLARSLRAMQEADAPSGEDAIAAFDRSVWLADESNMRLDKLTMAHSIEARAAFEAPRLLDLACSMPMSAKAGRWAFRPKMLLKEAFAICCRMR